MTICRGKIIVSKVPDTNLLQHISIECALGRMIAVVSSVGIVVVKFCGNIHEIAHRSVFVEPGG